MLANMVWNCCCHWVVDIMLRVLSQVHDRDSFSPKSQSPIQRHIALQGCRKTCCCFFFNERVMCIARQVGKYMSTHLQYIINIWVHIPNRSVQYWWIEKSTMIHIDNGHGPAIQRNTHSVVTMACAYNFTSSIPMNQINTCKNRFCYLLGIRWWEKM